MASLENLGLLREVTGRQRDRIYIYQPYLDLLREGTEPDVPYVDLHREGTEPEPSAKGPA